MALYPSENNREYDSVFQAAWNWYDIAVTYGITGLNPPCLNDTKVNLLSKTAYYTAAIDTALA